MRADLTTTYLGIQLTNPLVVSACPLTGDLTKLQQLQDAGAAAVVLPSLYEEVIRHQEVRAAEAMEHPTPPVSNSATFYPGMLDSAIGPDQYLNHLRAAKSSLKIPVIASLNGEACGSWIRYAKFLEDAGADALELNVYFVPTDPFQGPAEVEQRYFELVTAVREATTVPLSVKIGPYFTNIAYTARRLVEAGADGLVLFNRYLCPDIDVEHMRIEPQVVFSNRNELWLPLRWLAILSDQVSVSLAASSGVHFSEDIVKALSAGADVVMLTSALMQYGPNYLKKLHSELQRWMQEKGYSNIEPLRDSMNRANCPDASALERVHYTRALLGAGD